MDADQMSNPDPVAERREVAERLDPLDFRAVSRFGQEVSERLAALTEEQLALFKDGIDEEPSRILEAMVDELSPLRFDDRGRSGILASLPLIGELIVGDERSGLRLAETNERLDELMARLRAREARLEAEIGRLGRLEAEIARVQEDADVYIRGGEARLAELRSAVGADGAAAADARTAQELRDRQRALDHLERRLVQLRVTKLNALQSVGQIKLARDARHTFVQGVQELLRNSLPLWRHRLLVVRDQEQQMRARKARGRGEIVERRASPYRRARTDTAEAAEDESMTELTRRTLSAVRDKLKLFRALVGVDEGRD